MCRTLFSIIGLISDLGSVLLSASCCVARAEFLFPVQLRFTTGAFNTKSQSTIGVDITTWNIEVDGQMVEAQICDTAGGFRASPAVISACVLYFLLGMVAAELGQTDVIKVPLVHC